MATKAMARIKNARFKVKRFLDNREMAKELEAATKKEQPELVELLRELGVDNSRGIVYDESDPEKGVAYIQHNKAGEFWDEEAIQEWLDKPGNRSLKRKSQSTIFDINKFEAMIAAGEVPAKIAKKFKVTGERPAPFIRRGQKKDNSL